MLRILVLKDASDGLSSRLSGGQGVQTAETVRQNPSAMVMRQTRIPGQSRKANRSETPVSMVEPHDYDTRRPHIGPHMQSTSASWPRMPRAWCYVSKARDRELISSAWQKLVSHKVAADPFELTS